jgi:hypothetical protein
LKRPGFPLAFRVTQNLELIAVAVVLGENLAALLDVLPAIIGFYANDSAFCYPMADILYITVVFHNRCLTVTCASLRRCYGEHQNGGGGE